MLFRSLMLHLSLVVLWMKFEWVNQCPEAIKLVSHDGWAVNEAPRRTVIGQKTLFGGDVRVWFDSEQRETIAATTLALRPFGLKTMPARDMLNSAHKLDC
jgi:hypothetical protein